MGRLPSLVFGCAVVSVALFSCMNGPLVRTSTAQPETLDPNAMQLSIVRSKDGSFPEQLLVNGTTLRLQGSGLCEWGILGIDLYRAALWVERPIANASEALRADMTMVIHLDFVRGLSKGQLRSAWEGSAKANTGDSMPRYAKAVEQLCVAMEDVGDGDAYTFALEPGNGMTVLRNGREVTVIDDEDFRVLFVRMYLGDKPPTTELRDAMLGAAK